jgi:hypothetical protein
MPALVATRSIGRASLAVAGSIELADARVIDANRVVLRALVLALTAERVAELVAGRGVPTHPIMAPGATFSGEGARPVSPGARVWGAGDGATAGLLTHESLQALPGSAGRNPEMVSFAKTVNALG